MGKAKFVDYYYTLAILCATMLITELSVSSLHASGASIEYLLEFGTFTSSKDHAGKVVQTVFDLGNQISLTKAQWDLIEQKKGRVQTSHAISMSIDSEKFDFDVFKNIVLPIMDTFNTIFNLQKRESSRRQAAVIFYNQVEKNMSADNYTYQALEKAVAIADYLSLPVEICNILSNLSYDVEARLSEAQGAIVSKLELEKRLSFLKNNEKRLISMSDLPDGEILDVLRNSLENADFSNQALRSLNGFQRILDIDRKNESIQELREKENIPTITLNFSNNFIQEVDAMKYPFFKRDLVVILSGNPLSENAKNECAKLNGSFKTIEDFNQYVKRKERLAGWLQSLGYATEMAFAWASLYGLYRLNKSFSNRFVGLVARQGLPRMQVINKLVPLMLPVAATVGSFTWFWGGPLEGLPASYFFFHKHVTKRYLKFISKIKKLTSKMFIIFDK